MSLFSWRDDYALQVPRIDEEHKLLFAAGDKLHKAIVTGKSGPLLEPLIDELAEYGRTHFAHEEEFMVEIRYPRIMAHKGEHQSFTKRVEVFREAVHAGDRTLALNVLQFLKSWLVEHIGTSDVQVREHYHRQQGAPVEAVHG
jgi:hemerythrin